MSSSHLGSEYGTFFSDHDQAEWQNDWTDLSSFQENSTQSSSLEQELSNQHVVPGEYLHSGSSQCPTDNSYDHVLLSGTGGGMGRMDIAYPDPNAGPMDGQSPELRLQSASPSLENQSGDIRAHIKGTYHPGDRERRRNKKIEKGYVCEWLGCTHGPFDRRYVLCVSISFVALRELYLPPLLKQR